MAFCHTHRSVLCSVIIRDGTNTETHNATVQRVRDAEALSPTSDVFIRISPQGSMGKRRQKIVGTRDDSMKTVSSRHSRTDVHRSL